MMKKMTTLFAVLAIAIAALGARAEAQQFTKKMVGYQQSWEEIGNIDYDKLTHINFAFAVPSQWGGGYIQGLSADEDRRLRQLVQEAHAHDVKVLLSIGGDSAKHRWTGVVESSANVEQFVVDAMYLVTLYKLDGVDLDWEFPEEVADWNALVGPLEVAVHSKGKLFTAAVPASSFYGQYIGDISGFDFVNVMMFDWWYGDLPDASGSYAIPYDSAGDIAKTIASLDYWKTTHGLTADRLVLGIPFHGQPLHSTSAFRHPTSQHETKAWIAAREASGIMMWALNEVDGVDDTISDTNLVAKIAWELNTYVPENSYSVGDKVHHQGDTYVAVNSFNGGGIYPGSSPWFWRPVSSFDGNLFPGVWY